MKDIVIISGGANGLGKELINELIKQDKYIICNIDWDKNALSALKEELQQNEYYDFLGDVSDEQFIIDAINKISKLGNIKYLINNAGEPCFVKPTDNSSLVVDKVFKGLYGMINLTTQVLKQTNDCKIINIMSSAALRGNAGESVYCACKWAERGYTESLKAAYKGTNIKIIGVFPGGMNTDFYKNSRDYVSLEKQKTFMPAKDVAKIIINNIFNELNLTVADLIIERK